VFAVCTDLVFTFFICSAIVDPEMHGIIDAPISNVARSNLIVVAQILQVMALRKFQEIDAKMCYLNKHFSKVSHAMIAYLNYK